MSRAGRPGLRVATWNVEWFTNLFGRGDAPVRGRREAARAEAVAAVIRRVDPDLLLIVEAPDTETSGTEARRSTIRALEGFAADHGLRQRETIIGFQNDTQQELALMFDPRVVAARHDPQGIFSDGTGRVPGVPRFNGRFRPPGADDSSAEPHGFSKPPLEALVDAHRYGLRLRLIGVHTKSKNARGARDAAEERRIALANRRKLLTECFWIRGRVEEHLDRGESVIVLGDLNDGPGLDEYESEMGRSALEIVMGAPERPERMLHDPAGVAALRSRLGAQPATARFLDPSRRVYLNAMLDYVLISPDLVPGAEWRIWHPFDDAEAWEDAALRAALLTASDHFPVSVDLSPPAQPPGPELR